MTATVRLRWRVNNMFPQHKRYFYRPGWCYHKPAMAVTLLYSFYSPIHSTIYQTS
ncbi:MAG: hypothetical protein J0I41_10105 [Filimonas sp.]|nr:hypothetical protein [Filimonas sp.]